jgi:small multidrug resistance pump
MAWWYLALAIVCEVVATTALKGVYGPSRWASLAVVVTGYGLAFWFLALTLRHIPLSVGYAVWSGVGIVLVSLLGWLVWRQRLDTPALLGIGLILAGVLVIRLCSKSTA